MWDREKKETLFVNVENPPGVAFSLLLPEPASPGVAVCIILGRSTSPLLGSLAQFSLNFSVGPDLNASNGLEPYKSRGNNVKNDITVQS
jgi:hypothetical protein